jgi:hypothetical protein
MYTGPLRLLRALTVSATCVALSFAAHLAGAASGTPVVTEVAGAGLLMVIVLLTLVLAALSGRRWTLGRSLVAVAFGQVGLHTVFSVLLTSPHRDDSAMNNAMGGGMSMVLAHSVAALLIGLAIAVSDCALDTYFAVAASRVGSGLAVLSPWLLAGLLAGPGVVTRSGAAGRGEAFARWRRPRILTDLVVLQCLSRRGPPELALAS